MYGDSITFEDKHQNLGQWHAEGDYAVWTAELSKPETCDVWMTYACDRAVAGNMYLIQAGAAALTGRIDATGDWDRYRRVKLGRISLPPGSQKITFRSNGAINGYLCDLRELELLPVEIPKLPGRN
jgi:hypothetical protein